MQAEKPVAEEIDLSSMPVDGGYDGPMMEGTFSACVLKTSLDVENMRKQCQNAY